MSAYPGLGFDPARGEPGDVAAALQSMADAGSQLSVLVEEVTTALDLSQGWKGDAADDFHDNLDDIPPALVKGSESMGKAAEALGHWVQRLVNHKREADALNTLAVELKAQIEIAEGVAAAAVGGARMARGSQAEAAADAADAAVAKVASLHKQLDVVIDNAREVQREHLLDANTTADMLRAAKGDAFETPGGGAQALGSVGAVASKVSTWTGYAATVAAAVTVFVPPVGVVAGGLTITAGVTGVGGAAAQAGAKALGDPKQANTSWVSLGADGVLSVAGARGAKASTNLVKALRRPVNSYKKGRATIEVTKALGGGGARRQAGRSAIEGGKNLPKKLDKLGRDVFDETPLGKAIKTYSEVNGHDRASEAARAIGKIRAEEIADRGVAETALDKLLAEKYKQELKDRLDLSERKGDAHR